MCSTGHLNWSWISQLDSDLSWTYSVDLFFFAKRHSAAKWQTKYIWFSCEDLEKQTTNKKYSGRSTGHLNWSWISQLDSDLSLQCNLSVCEGNVTEMNHQKISCVIQNMCRVIIFHSWTYSVEWKTALLLFVFVSLSVCIFLPLFSTYEQLISCASWTYGEEWTTVFTVYVYVSISFYLSVCLSLSLSEVPKCQKSR